MAETQEHEKPQDHEKLLTRQELSAEFGVAPGTVTRWERDGMPFAKRSTRGRPTLFSPSAVRRWLTSLEQQRDATGALSLSDERARLAQLQGERIELELAVKRRELISTEEVIREGQALVKGYTAKLRTLPRRAVQLGIVAPAQLLAFERLVHELVDEIRGFKISTASRTER